MKQEVKLKQTEIGMIPEDWEIGTLSNIATFKNGKKSPERDNSEQYFVWGSNGIIGKSNKTNAQAKTNIIGRVGSYCGSVYYSKEKCWVTDNAIIAEPKDNSYSEFLFYLLKRLNLHQHRGGSGQPLLNQTTLNNIKIPLPKKDEQKKIAKILSDLDSKIEILQQKNKTLERIGKILFKEWFVDFEFLTYKGKPYNSSGGELVESELGMIPEDWKIKELQEFIDVQKGLSYKGKHLVESEGLPMANLGTFKPLKGFKPEGIKFYDGEHKERHLIKQGDMLIANTDITQKRDVLGSPAIIPKNIGAEKIIFTHHTFAVRPKLNYLPTLFIYYLLQTPNYRNRARGFAIGTTVLALPKEAVLELKFVCAPKNLLDNFDKFVKPLFVETENNNEEIESLSKTRDLLLPKLMSGKIRVMSQ